MTTSYRTPPWVLLLLLFAGTSVLAQSRLRVIPSSTVVTPTNLAPVVSAGNDATTTVAAGATLIGTVTDDGLPTGSTVTQLWTNVSGPATASFGTPSATTTTASFQSVGTYILRLTATDTLLSTPDDVMVTVEATATLTERYIDEGYWTSATNGFGPVEIKRSNGVASAAPDGWNKLTIAGQVYTRGLGVFAISEICYPTPSTVTHVRASLGISDEVGNNGSVRFVIESPNGTERWRSPTITGSDAAAYPMDVPLTNPTEVCLRVEDNGTGGAPSSNDSAVWGNIRLNNLTALTDLCNLSTTTRVNPGSSIQNALNAEGVGGVVCLNNGVHRLPSSPQLGLVPLQGQTIIGESRDGVMIIGSRALPSTGSWIPVSGSWYATGQTQQGIRAYYSAMQMSSAAGVAPTGNNSGGDPNIWCMATNANGGGTEGQNYPSRGNQRGVNSDGSARPRQLGDICGFPENVWFDGQMLQPREIGQSCEGPRTVAGQTFKGEWFFDYANDRIHVCGQDPNGHAVETSVVEELTSHNGTASDVRLLRMSWKWFASPTMRYVTYGGAMRIDSVTCSQSHGACLNVGPGYIVRRSLMYDNGEYGAGGDGSSGLFEYNEVHRNGWAGNGEHWGTGGTKFAGKTRMTIRANYFHHNGGGGVWSDTCSGTANDPATGNICPGMFTLYEDNRAEYNNRGGIFHEYSGAAVIKNNLVRYNGQKRNWDTSNAQQSGWSFNGGIEVLVANNVEVYGNVLVDNLNGLTGLEENRGPLDNISFHHNAVIKTATATAFSPFAFGQTMFGDAGGTDAISEFTFFNNTYCIPTDTTWRGFSVVANAGTSDLTDQQWHDHAQTTGTETIIRSNTCTIPVLPDVPTWPLTWD